MGQLRVALDTGGRKSSQWAALSLKEEVAWGKALHSSMEWLTLGHMVRDNVMLKNPQFYMYFSLTI